MRIRASVAVVTGALALTALAVPAAQAADPAPSFGAGAAKVLQTAHAASGRTAFGVTTAATATAADGQPYALDVSVSTVKTGKAHKVGTTNHVAVPVSYRLTHGADVDVTAADFENGPFLYKGSYAKTVCSDKYGNVKATTTAKYDGYWRFSFAGTTTTPAVNATGDYVDVR
ncbi:hypothetical protein ACFSL4_20265 [Streptomyces caeni]|uniref:Lipoprotein n=1 Tax=Streptomyces caeni TaxID=2307231 RepID=A0ABW4ISX4_9ACTN